MCQEGTKNSSKPNTRPTMQFNDYLHNNYQQVRYLYNEYYHNAGIQSMVKEVMAASVAALKRNNKIIIIGCGKSFKIASKCVAMLHSLGLSSALLHPIEALHGDMGVLKNGDVVWVCSSSGETQEILQIINTIQGIGTISVEFVSFVGVLQSSIGKECQYDILIPQYQKEAEVQNGLKAPTLSTASMLMLLDCMVLHISDMYYSCPEERNRVFNQLHPGGSIGSLSQPKHESYSVPVIDTRAPSLEDTSTISSTTDTETLLSLMVLNDFIQVKDKTIPAIAVQEQYRLYIHSQSSLTFYDWLLQALFN